MIHVAAFTSRLQERLAPLDTVHSTMLLNNGNSGTFSLSMGAEFKRAFEFQVVTNRGTVTVALPNVTVLQDDSRGEPVPRIQRFKADYDHALEKEIASFAKAIGTQKMDPRASPEEALADLKILQAMLESGEDGGTVKSVR